MSEVIAAALMVTVIGTLVLTPIAVAMRSWSAMLVAAHLSLLLSLVTGFSIGPYVFLFTCLQLAGALGLRWSAGLSEWVILLVLAVLVWAAVVLGPLHAGVGLPWLLAFPLVAGGRHAWSDPGWLRSGRTGMTPTSVMPHAATASWD